MSEVKVNLKSMSEWSTRMNSINEGAIDILQNFEQNLRELENYWVGDSAHNFINASLGLSNKAQEYHNNMKKTSNFLIETANRMNQQ